MRGQFSDDDEVDDQDVGITPDLPQIMAKVTSKLGIKGMAELNSIGDWGLQNATPEQCVQKIGGIFLKYGLSIKETIDFIMAAQRIDLRTGIIPNAVDSDKKIESTPIAGLTAEDRKADRKQRTKELEKRKREASQSRSRR